MSDPPIVNDSAMHWLQLLFTQRVMLHHKIHKRQLKNNRTAQVERNRMTYLLCNCKITLRTSRYDHSISHLPIATHIHRGLVSAIACEAW